MFQNEIVYIIYIIRRINLRIVAYFARFPIVSICPGLSCKVCAARCACMCCCEFPFQRLAALYFPALAGAFPGAFVRAGSRAGGYVPRGKYRFFQFYPYTAISEGLSPCVKNLNRVSKIFVPTPMRLNFG